MSYPRYQLARQFKKKETTTGNYTLNQSSTTWANVDTALDMTLDAQVGDIIEYGINALVANDNVTAYFDVVTVVSSTAINSLGARTTAPSTAATYGGVAGWRCTAAIFEKIGPAIVYVIQASDLDANGRVTLRLRYTTASATNRTLFASTAGSGYGLTVWAKNLGPQDDD